VPNLTLVDLPCLTKVATEGQDAAIVKMIEIMVLTYIKPVNSLILAVSLVNSDLASSDSLRIAKEVDPPGERTIGVITKIDILDVSTNCSAILCGVLYPLCFGYTGVVIRSQQDIERKKKLKDARDTEMSFFSSPPVRCWIGATPQFSRILYRECWFTISASELWYSGTGLTLSSRRKSANLPVMGGGGGGPLGRRSQQERSHSDSNG
jgi:hypothetical protein